MKCSPGFSSRASLNRRISSSKIVPIVGLSTTSGWRSHLAEALKHLEEQAGLVQLADRVVEIEPLDHLPHVLAESRDVVAEVRGYLGRVRQEPVEVVVRGVVEGEAGGEFELVAPGLPGRGP